MISVGDPLTIVQVQTNPNRIVLLPSEGCSYGVFDYQLVVTMAAYPSIILTKDFQITIKDPCDPTQVVMPAIANISNEIFVFFSTGFTLAQNISTYCGLVTYTFNWVSASQSVVASIDAETQLLSISSNS